MRPQETLELLRVSLSTVPVCLPFLLDDLSPRTFACPSTSLGHMLHCISALPGFHFVPVHSCITTTFTGAGALAAMAAFLSINSPEFEPLCGQVFGTCYGWLIVGVTSQRQLLLSRPACRHGPPHWSNTRSLVPRIITYAWFRQSALLPQGCMHAR